MFNDNIPGVENIFIYSHCMRKGAAPMPERPLRLTPSLPRETGLQARVAELVQVDGRRGWFGAPLAKPVRLVLTLDHDREAGHEGRDRHKTDTQGANKRLPARSGDASSAAPAVPFDAERAFESKNAPLYPFLTTTVYRNGLPATEAAPIVPRAAPDTRKAETR